MKKIKTYLTNGLAALAIGSCSGCGDNPQKYLFDGKIGDEHVSFYREGYKKAILKVKKQNGDEISFIDESNLPGETYGGLDEVIIKSGETIKINDNKNIQKLQIEYDRYKKMIRQEKDKLVSNLIPLENNPEESQNRASESYWNLQIPKNIITYAAGLGIFLSGLLFGKMRKRLKNLEKKVETAKLPEPETS